MAASTDLTEFVRDALIAGRSREEIAAALRDAGWSQGEIDAGLGAFADHPFLPPVPRPRRSLASRDAFLYALMFLTLGLTAGHLISLVFAVIDIWVPDIGTSSYRILAAEGQIRWAFAVLVLATPLYLWLMRLSDQQNAGEAGAERVPGRRSALRRWLTYLALLVSAVTLLGDAAFVIYRLLAGDATAVFLLKSLTVGIVAAGIFAFYLRDAERGQGRRAVRGFGIGVGGAVLLALAAGFWSIGGPGQARRDRVDMQRLEELSEIAQALTCTRNDGHPAPLPETLTPDSLTGYCPGWAQLTRDSFVDPLTGAPYAYRRLSESRFEICAGFHDATRAAARRSFTFPFNPETGCLSGRVAGRAD